MAINSHLSEVAEGAPRLWQFSCKPIICKPPAFGEVAIHSHYTTPGSAIDLLTKETDHQTCGAYKDFMSERTLHSGCIPFPFRLLPSRYLKDHQDKTHVKEDPNVQHNWIDQGPRLLQHQGDCVMYDNAMTVRAFLRGQMRLETHSLLSEVMALQDTGMVPVSLFLFTALRKFKGQQQ